VEAHRWRFAEVTEPVGRPYLEDRAVAVCGDGLLGGRVGDALRSGLALGQAWGASG
jgi:predicted NAD/FAD-dependent oxidoreductase